MRTFGLIFIFLLFLVNGFAAKKTKPASNLQLKDAWFSERPSPRNIGREYEFVIKVLQDDIRIDSVWFGATPVPCDVWNEKKTQRVVQLVKNETCRISCNRDLYRYFSDRYDSTKIPAFQAPFQFQGEAVILYHRNSKAITYKVFKIRRKAPQKTRQ